MKHYSISVWFESVLEPAHESHLFWEFGDIGQNMFLLH